MHLAIQDFAKAVTVSSYIYACMPGPATVSSGPKWAATMSSSHLCATTVSSSPLCAATGYNVAKPLVCCHSKLLLHAGLCRYPVQRSSYHRGN